MLILCVLSVFVNLAQDVGAVGPSCFSCSKIPFPRDCDTVVQCGEHEECGVEEVVLESGHVVFNVGCEEKTTCQLAARRKRGETFRNKRTDILTCLQCCNEGYCNYQGCGETGFDLETRGPYCFHCDVQVGQSNCDTVTVCGNGERCMLQTNKLFPGVTETLYKSGCASVQQCLRAELQATSADTCATCCDRDFCNTKCTYTNITSQTTQPVKTTKTTTSTSVSTTRHQHHHHHDKITKPSTHAPYTHPVVTHPPHTRPSVTHAPTHRPDPCNRHGSGYFTLPHSTLCVKIHREEMLWSQAVKTCKGEHSRLLVLDTAEKNAAVLRLLNGHKYANTNIWIGLYYHTNYKTFTWINGQRMTFGDWGDANTGHQPENGDHSTKCVMMWHGERHHWHDTICNVRESFICEAVTDVQTHVQTHTDPCREHGRHYFYLPHSHMCVKIHPEARTWSQAVETCKSEKSRLVVLDSADKISAASRYINGRHSYANLSLWIGLNYNANTKSFSWTDGQKLTYQDWGKIGRQPNHDTNHRGDSQVCVRMYQGEHHHWHDTTCDVHCAFICEALNTQTYVRPTTVVTPVIALQTTCQAHGIGYSNAHLPHSDMCVRVHNESKTWYEAVEICNAERSRLVVLDTQEKADTAVTFLNRFYKNQDVWIGLNDRYNKSQFFWQTGHHLTYSNWGGTGIHQQPDNGIHNVLSQNCVLMLAGDGHRWHDDHCWSRAAFICEAQSNRINAQWTHWTPYTTCHFEHLGTDGHRPTQGRRRLGNGNHVRSSSLSSTDIAGHLWYHRYRSCMNPPPSGGGTLCGRAHAEHFTEQLDRHCSSKDYSHVHHLQAQGRTSSGDRSSKKHHFASNEQHISSEKSD